MPHATGKNNIILTIIIIIIKTQKGEAEEVSS